MASASTLGFDSTHPLGSWRTGFDDDDSNGYRAILLRAEGLCLVVAREVKKGREARMLSF